MFCKTIILVCMLFGLADGAKYKITSSDKNRHVTKDEKINVVKKHKEHITSLKSKFKNTESIHDTMAKTLEETKELQAWNTYNPEFNTIMYNNMMFWDGEDCDGHLNLQMTDFVSYCYVFTAQTFDLQTYSSGRLLFNSAGTSVTAAYYTSNDCSGTPARQGNTKATWPGSKDSCITENDIDDTQYMGSSITAFKSSSMEAWEGEGAVKISEYSQTSTCSGTPESTLWIRGGCYQNNEYSSLMYKEGPTVLYYNESTSCSGEYFTINFLPCEESDDDDDDDDDNYNDITDDAQFDYILIDDEAASTSSSVTWVGGSDNLCEKGMYRMNGMCNLCPAGFYSDGMESCTMCDEGTYAPYFSSECYDCPPGTFAVNKGSSECHLCPVNTYPNSQKSKCLPCPEGQIAAPGSSQCLPCGGLGNNGGTTSIL